MKVCTLLLALAFGLICESVAWAAQCPGVRPGNTFTEFVLANLDGTGAKRWAVLVEVPANGWFDYVGIMMDPNNPGLMVPCDCPNAHHDCQASSYDHIHFAWALPQQGSWDGMNFQNITTAMAEAFWDDEYLADGYQRAGTLDNTSNCYGYCTGLGTWIQSFNTVRDHCYLTTSLANLDAVLAEGQGHCIKIDGSMFCPDDHTGGFIITGTSEKYRDSPIYSKAGACPTGVQLKGQLRGGTNFNAKSLAPYTLYKKAP